MPKILSIIIPSYNMEKYLPYCLDSLLVHNHQEELEVLVVNDGSTDNTYEEAQRYANAYPGVFCCIDKKNGNYGSCINVGLSKATGKYVKVLDADDSFDVVNFDEFLEFLTQIDADLILSDFEVVNNDRVPQRTIRYNFPIKGVGSFYEICNTSEFVGAIQMHAVTYRRELLRSMHYHQTEGISYTDQQWIFTPMIAVKTVAYFGAVVYRYLVGREGQTMDPKVRMRSMEHARKNSLGLILDYETHKGEISSPMIKSYLYSRLAWYIKDIYITHITNYTKVNAAILRDYDQSIKEQSIEIYNMIASKDISSVLGFAYIDYWRRHKIPSVLVNIFARVVKILMLVKSKINSRKDKLSIGN